MGEVALCAACSDGLYQADVDTSKGSVSFLNKSEPKITELS